MVCIHPFGRTNAHVVVGPAQEFGERQALQPSLKAGTGGYRLCACIGKASSLTSETSAKRSEAPGPVFSTARR